MTIYDIAKEAGVSASTVSRVINGKSTVNVRTREKVQKLLQKHNFSPDENARGLVTRASKLIGIVVEDIRNTHHTAIAYVVEQHLSQMGYCGIVLSTSVNSGRIAAGLQILEQRRVEGVILVGSVFQDVFVLDCISRNLPDVPIVLANGMLERENIWNLLVDEYSGMKKCVELFYSIGKQRIAYIQKPSTASGVRKKQGFIDIMCARGVNEQDILIINATPDMDGGYRSTVSGLHAHPDIDAILYSEDILAVGGLRALHDLHKRIPQDIAIIGVDNSVHGRTTFPQLTSLDTGMEQLGVTAARTLLNVIDGKEMPRLQEFGVDIVMRETT